LTAVRQRGKRPLPTESPIDVVIVKSPSSHRGYATPGWVVTEHLSTTGLDDQIARPSDQAVPLFWRFMAEKFAITSLTADPSTPSIHTLTGGREGNRRRY
jgi:hypothetical protein